MKKSFRIFALLAALTLLVCSLVGCSAPLDEMRAAQGFWNEDGSISYDGNVYKLLPYCEDLNPIRRKYINITEGDVPVLLSEMMGTECYISNDGVFIINTVYGYGENEMKYCRADKYDEIVERIENGVTLDGYCHVYYDYTLETERAYKFSYREVEAINETLAGEPMTLPSGANMEWDYKIDVYRCSYDLIFRSDALNIYITNGVCTLMVYNPTDGHAEFYEVSEENKAIFDGIVRDFFD